MITVKRASIRDIRTEHRGHRQTRPQAREIHLGGGVTQMAMPLLFAGFKAVSLGVGAVVRATDGDRSFRARWCCSRGSLTSTCSQGHGGRRLRDMQTRRMAGLPPRAERSAFRPPRFARVWVPSSCPSSALLRNGLDVDRQHRGALLHADNFHPGVDGGFVAASFGMMMNIFARALGGIE